MSESSRSRSRTPLRAPPSTLGAELPGLSSKLKGRNENVLNAMTHIKAYMNISGQQMGLAGVGCAHGKALDTWGLIPTKLTAQQLTATPHWWRILPTSPEPGEEIKVGIHFEPMELGWSPAQVWYARKKEEQVDQIAVVGSDDPAWCGAQWIILSPTVLPIVTEVIPQVDIAVSTPPTPSSIEDSDGA